MDNRVFDVSKPHHSRPDASGKPVIVGHHPQMTDPMVREHAPIHPAGTHPSPTSHPGGNQSGPLLPTDQVMPSSKPPTPPSQSLQANNFGGSPQAENPSPLSPKPSEVPAQTFPQPAGLTPAPVPAHHETWHPDKSLPIPAHPGHHSHGPSQSKKLPAVVLLVVAILLGLYALVDAGVVGGSIKLPFHIFSQEKTAESPNSEPPVTPAPASNLPAGFIAYKLADNDLSFAYPATWGAPSIKSEPGFTKRGGENKTNGTYALILNFATNKDVQIVLTSGQYLPPARAALYYDFQQWCKGTADGKIYKQLLRFTTTDDIDTPTTVTCDQGPLTDAKTLYDNTIAQTKTTNPDGSALGDLYTVNMSDNDWPALRVKDAKSANAEDIKKLLITISN